MNGCPSDGTLQGLLVEQLPSEDLARLSAHIEECTECQTRVEQQLRRQEAQLPLLHRPSATESADVRFEPDCETGQEAQAPSVPGISDASTVIEHRCSDRAFLEDLVQRRRSSSAAPHSSPPGYEIRGELGRGGMGVVYLAEQVRLKRLVALKFVLAGTRVDREQLARFRAEAEAIARLRHSNIIQIHEVGDHDGLPFLILEYLDAGSLDQKLTAQALSPAEAARLLQTLAQAVHYAHDQGIIHRDLKPANVLFTADGTPKLTDFGLAKHVDGEHAASAKQHTATGTIAGTPSYMAPEQALGVSREMTATTDVYALGAILYEMLTGRPPFKGSSVLETLEQVRLVEPVAPRLLAPRLPRDLETICLKCLGKEPAKRYASAADLADDLGRFLDGRPIVARPLGRPARLWRWCQRNRAVAGLLLAVFTSLLVGAAIATTLAVLALASAAEADLQRGLAEGRAEQIRRDRDNLLAANVLVETAKDNLLHNRLAKAVADYDAALALKPDHSFIWRQRGLCHCYLGLWPEAAADFRKAFQLAGDSTPGVNPRYPWYQYPFVAILDRDLDTYRTLCRTTMTARLASADNESLESLDSWDVLACILGPDALGDPPGLVEVARRYAKKDVRPLTTMLVGAAHYRAGQFEEARTILADQAAQETDAFGWLFLAMAEHRLGRPQVARAWIDKVDRVVWRAFAGKNLAPPYGVPMETWTKWATTQAIYQEAAVLICGSVQLEQTPFHLVRARGLGVLARADQAVAAYLQVLEHKSQDPDVVMEVFRYYVHVGRWQEARSTLTQLARLLPLDPKVAVDACLEYARKARWDDAQQALTLAVERDPADNAIRLTLVRFHLDRLQFDEADLEFARIVKQRPGDLALRFAYVKLHFDRKLYARAVAVCDQILTLRPEAHAIWHYKAQCHSALNQPEAAVAALSRAIEFGPGVPTYWDSRAYERLMQGQWREAAADGAQAVRLKDDVPDHWERLAVARFHTGPREEYRKVCAAFFARFSSTNDPKAAFQLASATVLDPQALPDFNALVALLLRCEKQLGPEALHFHLGAAYYRAGQFDKAQASYEQYHRRHGNLPQAHFFQAMALHKLDRSKEARAHLALGQQLAEQPVSGLYAYLRIFSDVIRREAEQLLGEEE